MRGYAGWDHRDQKGWAMTPAEKKDMLLRCAVFVESIPDSQFNIEHWWLPDGKAFDDDRNCEKVISDVPCGCAVGNMLESRFLPMSIEDLWATYQESHGRDRIWVVIGNFFGLSCKISEFMFSQYAYPSLKVSKYDVARRVRYIASEFEQAVSAADPNSANHGTSGDR